MDGFYELIYLDEFARVGGGHVLGQVPVDSMALPPIIAHATPEVKAKARDWSQKMASAITECLVGTAMLMQMCVVVCMCVIDRRDGFEFLASPP